MVLIALFVRLLAKKYGIVKRSERPQGNHFRFHYDKTDGCGGCTYIVLSLSCKLMSHRDAMFPPSPHAGY